MFMNVMRDDCTISVLILEIIVEHDHTIYIDKREIAQFGSRNETDESTISVYIK